MTFNSQVIRNYLYGPQSRGATGALIFWLQVSGMTLYYRAFARLVRGYKLLMHIISFVFMHQSFVTSPAQRYVEDFDFVSAVPIVTTIVWGQLAGKTMTVLPRSLLLY